ncbi:hypothetical protein C1750_14925 [Stenotrophomonas pavanii]|nr:hypothetical protein ABB31_06015 [Stenotrophomonas pavanii]PNY71535.1 hypothetical protein C1750_14925 [Stenotrophomonas pavanii]
MAEIGVSMAGMMQLKGAGVTAFQACRDEDGRNPGRNGIRLLASDGQIFLELVGRVDSQAYREDA